MWSEVSKTKYTFVLMYCIIALTKLKTWDWQVILTKLKTWRMTGDDVRKCLMDSLTTVSDRPLFTWSKGRVTLLSLWHEIINTSNTPGESDIGRKTHCRAGWRKSTEIVVHYTAHWIEALWVKKCYATPVIIL